MSNWPQIATDAAEVAFGGDARIQINHISSTHVVTWIEDGIGKVLAVAGGDDSAKAWTALIVQCYREDHRPTTQEAAAALGVTDNAIRQRIMLQTLIPAKFGRKGLQARFAAQDVWNLLTAKRNELKGENEQ